MSDAEDFSRLSREFRGQDPWRASALLLLLVACIAMAGVWAAWAEVDDVTRADGRVVPSSDVHLVQAPEAGIVTRFGVAEGDVVAEEALLAELDGTTAAAQVDELSLRAFALAARIARLEAEVAGAEPGFAEPRLPGAAGIVASERDLHAARAAQVEGEIAVLETQRRQRQEDLRGAEADLGTAVAQMALFDRETGILEPLVRQRLEPETALLALQRSAAEAEGRRVRSQSAIARGAAALAEIDDRIRALRQERRAEALGDLARARAELAEVQARLPALSQRLARSELRAPMRAIVNRITVPVRGAVVQAGQTVMELVPVDDTLLVEAYVRPADIAFLRPGLPVRVKLTAYDFARYGGLDGRIVRIGADAVQRPDREETAYLIEVRTESAILDAGGATVEILPGMVAQVDILTGRKTVLDYLIRPVVRVKDEAFRD
jgi:adhesin transport system membrane fusion protein